MTDVIRDGTGNGYLAEVSSDNKLRVRAISETSVDHASENGNAYNINTGDIASLANGTSALVYFKNGEDKDFIVESIAVGLTDGTASDIQKITVTFNDTAGTIISNATPVSMNANRNAGSAKTLSSSLAYKGADTYTATGGTDVGQFYMTDNGRLFANVGFVLPKNTSMTISLTAALSSGTVTAYAAIIGHIEDII